MPASAENLATFVEVVRRRSLSAAARSAGIPKSTVSRRLRRLEQELQQKLLERDARKMALTPAGRRLFEAVASPIDALASALNALEDDSQTARGTIRISVLPDLGRMVLSPMLVAFLERYPEIALDVLYTTRVVDLAAEGVDVAVRAVRSVAGELVARKLCEAELQVATGARQTEPSWTKDGPRSLERQPFVLYGAEAFQQTIRLERTAGGRHGGVELRVTGRLRVDDYAAAAELIAAGHGVGLLPALHVREGVQAGRLVRLFPEWASRTGHVYIVYPVRQRAERVRVLVEFLREAFARVGQV